MRSSEGFWDILLYSEPRVLAANGLTLESERLQEVQGALSGTLHQENPSGTLTPSTGQASQNNAAGLAENHTFPILFFTENTYISALVVHKSTCHGTEWDLFAQLTHLL